MLDPEYAQSVLTLIVDSALAESMDVGHLNMADALAASSDDPDYPAEIVEHVFRSFCLPLDDDQQDFWKLNVRKLTVFVGLHLLKAKVRMVELLTSSFYKSLI